MRNNFLITIGLGAVFSVVSIIYILNMYEPSLVLFYFLVFLIFIFITLLTSLLMYKFSTIQRFEDSKAVYRRCLKKSLFVGIVFALFFLIQYYFDVL